MKKAFTLAEVLITLTIVGIIAAMTIPTVTIEHKKQVYVAQLKKAYTEVTQGLKILSQSKGCIDNLACTGYFSTGASISGTYNLLNDLSNYMNYTKLCVTGLDPRPCMAEWNRDLDQTTGGERPVLGAMQTLSNYSFGISSPQIGNCTSALSYNGVNVCNVVYIDVNTGTSGPNQYGRDIFTFYIMNNCTLIPTATVGGSALIIQGNCTTTDGKACSEKILEDGWQMNY